MRLVDLGDHVKKSSLYRKEDRLNVSKWHSLNQKDFL